MKINSTIPLLWIAFVATSGCKAGINADATETPTAVATEATAPPVTDPGAGELPSDPSAPAADAPADDAKSVRGSVGPEGGTVADDAAIPGLVISVPPQLVVVGKVTVIATVTKGSHGETALSIAIEGADLPLLKPVAITLPPALLDGANSEAGQLTVLQALSSGQQVEFKGSMTISTVDPTGIFTVSVQAPTTSSGSAPGPAPAPAPGRLAGPAPSPSPASARFTVTRGLSGSVEGSAKAPDGKLLIVGDFLGYGDAAVGRLARLLPDGTLDTSFNANLGSGFGYAPLSVAVDQSNRVVVGGMFTTLDGQAVPYLVRLNADGTKDSAFLANLGTGPNQIVYGVAIDGNGKILIVGAFSSVNGTPLSCIARLNDDGTIDATFNPGTGFNGAASMIHLGAGGKIYVGGSNFTQFNGVSRARMARLNADGSLDGSFDIGTGFDSYVYAIVEDSTAGRVYVGGWFRNVNGVPVVDSSGWRWTDRWMPPSTSAAPALAQTPQTATACMPSTSPPTAKSWWAETSVIITV